MIGIDELKRCAQEDFEYVSSVSDIREAELFLSANGNLLCRLNYTSNIPCNGVEEPKSSENYGIGVQAVFNTEDGLKLGFGSEPSDISVEGVKKALEKARKNAIHDPDFVCLPKPPEEKRTLINYHDDRLLNIADEDFVRTGWKVLDRSLGLFSQSDELKNLSGNGLKELGLIVGGDVTIIQEKIAVVSHSMPQVQTDESSIILSFITSMIESKNSKGSGYSAHMKLDDFTGSSGEEASRNAVKSIGGVRVKSGEYDIVFGHQAVMDLVINLLAPGLNIGAFDAVSSPFMGKLAKQIASEKFNIIDNGNAPDLAGSKGITCEGLPTGKTKLIENGVLVGLLSNYYYHQKMLNDKNGKEKLGVDPSKYAGSFFPRSGFRFALGGGRSFRTPPGISGTNLVIHGDEPCSVEDLLKQVGNGLYIGRLWYTYPVNGLRAGDFSSTAISDSYLIRDGKITTPLKPNSIRLNDNIVNLLSNIIGISDDPEPTLVWAADEFVHAPHVAISRVNVNEIAKFTESL